MLKIKNVFARLFSSKKSTYRKPILAVESLESREVPATLNWIYTGTMPGNFSTAANWQGGVVPAATDDVFIGTNTGEMNIDSVRTIGKLTIDPATTTWFPVVDVSKPLNINNGITAKQATFNLPDVLTINGGVVRTDGSNFKSDAASNDLGEIDIKPNVVWNVFNTTESLESIKLTNWGTINFYDSGSLLQSTLFATNIINFGTIIADKSTENSLNSSIKTFGTFANMGTLQVNSEFGVAYGKLSIDASSITSVAGTININGGILEFKTRNILPIDMQEDVWNIAPGSFIISDKKLQTDCEVFNFNTTNTLDVSFYMDIDLLDVGSIINFNGPRASQAAVITSGQPINDWFFNNTHFNITIDETSNECSKFVTRGIINISGSVYLNVTILNPIAPIPNFWFNPFMIGKEKIWGEFAGGSTGNLGIKASSYNNVTHAQMQLGWPPLPMNGNVNPTNPTSVMVTPTTNPNAPASSVINFIFNPTTVTVLINASFIPMGFNASSLCQVPNTSWFALTFNYLYMPSLVDSVITLNFNINMMTVTLNVNSWSSTLINDPLLLPPDVTSYLLPPPLPPIDPNVHV